MKLLVIGLEVNEGTSKKTGNPYSIGKLHAALPMVGSANAKGYQGHTIDCEVSILRKVEHLPCPFEAEVETTQVMRYGKPQTEVLSVVPTAITKATPAPAAGQTARAA